MIGDREVPDETPDDDGLYGPLDAMVRLNPPPATLGNPLTLPPMWVERYGPFVVMRSTFVGPYPPDAPHESTTERLCPTEAVAIREMARLIAVLQGRGYTVVNDDRVSA